jgi:hypothetical protein
MPIRINHYKIYPKIDINGRTSYFIAYQCPITKKNTIRHYFKTYSKALEFSKNKFKENNLIRDKQYEDQLNNNQLKYHSDKFYEEKCERMADRCINELSDVLKIFKSMKK